MLLWIGMWNTMGLGLRVEAEVKVKVKAEVEAYRTCSPKRASKLAFRSRGRG